MSEPTYIDMGVWQINTKYIDPYSVKRNGKRVSLLVEGRLRAREFFTEEAAQKFFERTCKQLRKETGDARQARP